VGALVRTAYQLLCGLAAVCCSIGVVSCVVQAEVPGVCSGGITRKDNQTLDVSLAVLQASPECSMRVTLVPELSLRA
jgi:hypothetical protein